MTLVRWNPVRDLAALEVERLEKMFNGVFGEREGFGPVLAQSWMPAVDVYENAEGEMVLKAELPAVRRDDIKVSVEGQTLLLEAERHVGTDVDRDRFHRIERAYGTFRRTFTLPASVDASRIAAEYQDGLLTIRLPRREESKPRQIEVK
jgi:HSP20 family protein